MSAPAVLSVKDLSVSFGAGRSETRVVHDVSFTLRQGQTLALVGESGSGKTITGKALLGILPKGARVTMGMAHLVAENSVDVSGPNEPGPECDLLHMTRKELRDVRGRRVSMIFQEPMSSLSPLHTLGAQVMEAVRLHTTHRGAEAQARCLHMFEEVGFPDPRRAFNAYPFELSGGLRQRGMIAMAMVCRPQIMIADEPTTALDVTTQAMVLDLINRLQAETGMAVLMITHDLGVVANMASSVVVLRKGEVVESGPARAVIGEPRHGYTKALVAAAPIIPEMVPVKGLHDPEITPIMRARNLSKTYITRGSGLSQKTMEIQALSDVDVTIARGETVALVGESGSGKSTVANLLLRAERPDDGAEIEFCGRDGLKQDIARLEGNALKAFRRRVQVVFQDPFASLSPRMPVQDILTEPLRIHDVGNAAEQRDRAVELMRRVGLSPDHLRRYPHAFSGGQRQRICIARALALKPELILCDEPTSALDVSVQAQVLDLLREVKEDYGLSYLFISHDLAVVAELSDRVAVMRRGRIVEEGPVESLFSNPMHPYTKALIAASPEPDMDRPLDLNAVAQGAGEPHTWPEPFGYVSGQAPGMVEVDHRHFVRRAA